MALSAQRRSAASRARRRVAPAGLHTAEQFCATGMASARPRAIRKTPERAIALIKLAVPSWTAQDQIEQRQMNVARLSEIRVMQVTITNVALSEI
jgi:hypothetical protein